MKTIISWRIEPGDDGTIFAPDALDSLVRLSVPWTFRETDESPPRRLGTATITSVKVAPDGRSAEIEAELVRDVDTVPLPEVPSAGTASFAIPDHPAWPVTGDRVGSRPITADHGPGSPRDHDSEGD